MAKNDVKSEQSLDDLILLAFRGFGHFLFSNLKPPSLEGGDRSLGLCPKDAHVQYVLVCNQQIKEIKNMSRYESASHV
ncbi:hypothetical protein [Vibrio hyugaensis]|uniref:hypothetical protein n=1 Tax=Vibrio hyugaensis TaxID=1534743 RepID=UPI000A4A2230|nr:hypothetical protein [Vibrio hyugaensis]